VDSCRRCPKHYQSGNVGIGTAAPNHKFHVVAADAVGLFESSGSQAYLRLTTKEGLDNRVEIINRGGGRLSLWTAAGGDALNITRAGSVGIGTPDPQRKLHVESSEIHSGGNNAGYSFSNRGSSYVEGGNGDRWVWYAHQKVARLWSGVDKFSVDTGGTVRASGEIQTTSPNAFRMVSGTVGSFFRNDGSDTYLLLTNSGDPHGGWNHLRPLRINNASGQIFLSNLDVAEHTHAYVRCHDLLIGHPSRRGGPGRALVDLGETLHVNYDKDWKNVTINGVVRTPSSRQVKENIEALSSQSAKRIVSTLEPVRYTFKRDPEKLECLGFIAEDSPPEVASQSRDAIVINHIVAALTRVVKDQERSIGELEAQVGLLTQQQQRSRGTGRHLRR
jgi:hypothetical protein